MSLATLTTKNISDTIIVQLESAFVQSIPALPKSFMRVLSKTLAGVVILLYKYVGFMSLQQFVATASAKQTVINGVTVIPLVEWGRLIGVGDPVAATSAELTITVTVENQTGVLQSGSQLLNDNNGVTYITIGDVNLDAPTVVATIKAVSDQAGGNGAGEIGNLEVDDPISFANPLPNVARNAVVLSQVVTAADGENVDAVYRRRVIARFQQRPQGGALSDYKMWGEEVAGILNIYPYTSPTHGHIDVYVESSTEVDGIPTQAQLDAVTANIEYDLGGIASRRPAGALVTAYAITRLSFDVNVISLVVDNPSQVQADITEAITNYFLNKEPYIVGLSVPPRKDRITQAELSGVIDDIVGLAGGVFGGVTMELLSVVIPIYVLSDGEKAKVNVITFI